MLSAENVPATLTHRHFFESRRKALNGGKRGKGPFNYNKLNIYICIALDESDYCSNAYAK